MNDVNEPPSDGLLTIGEAAERLSVHYMTAYRYVRTGRLDGVKVGVEWRVRVSDVESFGNGSREKGAGRRSPAGYTERLVERLVVGDDAGVWAITENALTAGHEPADIYLSVLVPALAAVGEGWSTGAYSVAQEHQASTSTLRMIGRLSPRFNRPGRKRGSVIVGAPASDEHRIPVAIVADLLRGVGFRVHDLGCDVPGESFVEVGEEAERLVGIGIGSTSVDNEDNVRSATAEIRGALDVPVVLGGSAVRDLEHAQALGAEEYAEDGTDLVDRFVRHALDGRRTRRT